MSWWSNYYSVCLCVCLSVCQYVVANKGSKRLSVGFLSARLIEILLIDTWNQKTNKYWETRRLHLTWKPHYCNQKTSLNQKTLT